MLDIARKGGGLSSGLIPSWNQVVLIRASRRMNAGFDVSLNTFMESVSSQRRNYLGTACWMVGLNPSWNQSFSSYSTQKNERRNYEVSIPSWNQSFSCLTRAEDARMPISIPHGISRSHPDPNIQSGEGCTCLNPFMESGRFSCSSGCRNQESRGKESQSFMESGRSHMAPILYRTIRYVSIPS
jgi:hypothetical protein